MMRKGMKKQRQIYKQTNPEDIKYDNQFTLYSRKMLYNFQAKRKI